MSFVVPGKEVQHQAMEYQPNTLVPPSATPMGHQVPVGVMQGTLSTHIQAATGTQDEQHRWSQYQQLWRQHVYMNGTIRIRLRLKKNTRVFRLKNYFTWNEN